MSFTSSAERRRNLCLRLCYLTHVCALYLYPRFSRFVAWLTPPSTCNALSTRLRTHPLPLLECHFHLICKQSAGSRACTPEFDDMTQSSRSNSALAAKKDPSSATSEMAGSLSILNVSEDSMPLWVKDIIESPDEDETGSGSEYESAELDSEGPGSATSGDTSSSDLSSPQLILVR